MSDADELGMPEVCKALNRSEGTVRRFHRLEGLPFRKVGRVGRLVITRAELDEWRSRPEIVEMLRYGEMLKNVARGVGRREMNASA